jgi:hypothetical protein
VSADRHRATPAVFFVELSSQRSETGLAAHEPADDAGKRRPDDISPLLDP